MPAPEPSWSLDNEYDDSLLIPMAGLRHVPSAMKRRIVFFRFAAVSRKRERVPMTRGDKDRECGPVGVPIWLQAILAFCG